MRKLTPTCIIKFIEKILADTSTEQHILSLGVLSTTETQKLKEITGLDLDNYERILDNFAIKHALNKPRTRRCRKIAWANSYYKR